MRRVRMHGVKRQFPPVSELRIRPGYAEAQRAPQRLIREARRLLTSKG